MKSKYLSIGVVLLLSSCGLLGHSTVAKEESRNTVMDQSSLKSKTENQHWKDIKVNSLEQDSLKAAYSFRLWPKGKFVFSPDHGFEGDFDSVYMTGMINKATVVSSQARLRQQDKSKKDSDLQLKIETASLTKQEQKKNFPVSPFLLVGIILIIIVAFWLFKRKL